MTQSFDPDKLRQLADVLDLAASKAREMTLEIPWSAKRAQALEAAARIEMIAEDVQRMAEDIVRTLSQGGKPS